MEERNKKSILRRSQKDYSLAFKLEVVDQVEKGQLSYKQAQVKYGIQGRSTVLVWLRKHGSLDWKSKIPMKEKQPPRKKISELEAKVKRLEQEKMILNRAIDIADKEFGTNIRKKVFAPLAASFPAKGALQTTRKQIAQSLGYSRQYLYKLQKQANENKLVKQQVKVLVDAERKLLPRLGTRKLYFKLQPALTNMGIKLGRDKLFTWMREFDLLVRPARRYVQTTNSKHFLRKYPNLVKGLQLSAPEQVWVSDITYISTRQGTCYLNLVTDAFSRKIVGYAIAANMEAVSMGKALEMALKHKQTTTQTIHHSDRGLQYCSKHYVSLAMGNNMKMSMTQDSDPYENALAERMNRTMKEEFGLGKMLADLQQAELLTKQAVALYNNHRPHLSLHMKTPKQVHQKQIKIPAY